MEYLREGIDSFLYGLVVGLAIAIFISICFLVVDTYDRTKQIEYINTQYECEIEERKNELQGWEVTSDGD